jgi:hypothetical protein
MTLTAEERRALALLASASGNGTTQTFLSAHGFGVPMIAGLVNRGLATMLRQSQRSDEEVIVVTRVRITESGREALHAADAGQGRNPAIAKALPLGERRRRQGD